MSFLSLARSHDGKQIRNRVRGDKRDIESLDRSSGDRAAMLALVDCVAHDDTQRVRSYYARMR